MLKNSYDTIIIGAGPAGLSCAMQLKRLGKSDLLVAERCEFPRDKCCAGYITNKTKKAYEEFGLDVDGCGYTLIDDFRLIYKNREKQKIRNRFLYTGPRINRVELDDAFFRLAVSAGVTVAEKTAVISHDADAHTVTFSGGVTVKYRHIVFADGTLGFGSRYQDRRRRNIAMQLIFPTDKENGIKIIFGASPKGYGWQSTYNGRCNVGLTDYYDKNRDYRALFEEYLSSLGVDADVSGLYAAFTPASVGKPVIGDVYFVGDALGACDPLTLSGLRYGIGSGKAAAQSISASDPKILRRYAAALRFKFAISSALMRVFYLRPVQFLVFNVGCTVLRPFVTFGFNRFLCRK